MIDKYSDREFLKAYVNASMYLNELSDCPRNELEPTKYAVIEQMDKMIKLSLIEYKENKYNNEDKT